MVRLNASQHSVRFGHEFSSIVSSFTPVFNTWRTVFDSRTLASFFGGVGVDKSVINAVMLSIFNTETDSKTLEIEVTLDGVVFNNAALLAHLTWYDIILMAGSLNAVLSGNRFTSPLNDTSCFFNRVFNVDVRMTDPIGTNPAVYYRIFYGEQV